MLLYAVGRELSFGLSDSNSSRTWSVHVYVHTYIQYATYTGRRVFCFPICCCTKLLLHEMHRVNA